MILNIPEDYNVETVEEFLHTRFDEEYTIIKVEVDREQLAKAHSMLTEINNMIGEWLK